MLFRRVLSLAVLLLASVPLALAQGTYTQIDVPGALGSQPWGIDNVGDISGWYQDANGSYHGFLYREGTYTTIDYPSNSATLLYGMNNNEQIVGTGLPSGAFVYDIASQTFTAIACPGATIDTPYAINDHGVVVGGATVTGLNGTGFMLAGLVCTLIEFPGGTTTFTSGISEDAEIVGTAFAGQMFANFTLVKGEFLDLAIPIRNPVVKGISPDGTALVGSAALNPNSRFENTAGFVKTGRTVTVLAFPNLGRSSSYMVPTSINDDGAVVGYVEASRGVSRPRGFLWTPPADAAKK